MLNKTLLAGAATAGLAATMAQAEELDSADADTVVVVGSATRVDVSADDIEMLQANDLADIFRQTPSVQVGGSLGIAQKVYVRGLEDTLLNITVDGAPQTGTLFHHIGRVSIEPELLKQVEVQAGAGEATSGFGAIGGAIRFRTKDAEDLLQEGRRFGALAKAGYFSNDGYKLSANAYAKLTDDWNILGSYVWVDRENMEDGAGDPILGTAAEQSLAFVKLNGDITSNQTLSLSYERRHEEGEFGARPNWPAIEGETLFPIEAQRDTAVANYGLALNAFVNVEATGYYTKSQIEQDRFDRWGLYGAEIETFGFDLRNTTRVANHELIYGVEYRNDSVVSQYLDDPSVWGDWAWDPDLGRFEENGEVIGAYFQDHYRIIDPLLLSFGVRYDSYSLDQTTYDDSTSSDGWSGNVGAVYEITPSLSLIAGYAEAIRGKEVGDAFTLERRPGRITLDPDLRAERVKNREFGARFDDGRFRASAAYYLTRINNVILDQIGAGAPPQDAVYFENVGTYEAEGFEVQAGFSFNALHADVFFTTYDAELNGHAVEGYEEIGLGNASGDAWNFNLAYTPTPDLELGWNTSLVQDLNDITVLYRAVEIGWIDSLQQIDKPGYAVHDLYLLWRPFSTDAVAVSFAVQNLFDKHYRDHASVGDYNHIPGWEGVAGLYEAGRDVRVSLTLRY